MKILPLPHKRIMIFGDADTIFGYKVAVSEDMYLIGHSHSAYPGWKNENRLRPIHGMSSFPYKYYFWVSTCHPIKIQREN